LKTKVLLLLGVAVAACIAAVSWTVYAAFNQPLAASGFLVAIIVLVVVVRIALLNRVITTKQRASEQAFPS